MSQLRHERANQIESERKHEHIEEVVYKIRLMSIIALIGCTASICGTIAYFGIRLEVRLSSIEIRMSNHDSKFTEQEKIIQEIKGSQTIIFNKIIDSRK